MSIRQVKENEATKDGRNWVVDLTYKDYLGRRKRYHSKKFATRREAKDHEAEYKTTIKNQTEFDDITFEELIDEHYKYQLDKVKTTTLTNYRNMKPYLEPLFKLKIQTFNIRHYEMWRQFMNEKKISTRYKNGVYKYLKAVMNFGTKWYDINFVKVYNKMSNFNNPNERRKEMQFYTPEEFQQFLSVENDIKYICAFQTLFYCGLRNGELRGLTWNDINFKKSILSINKAVTKVPNEFTGKPYTVSSPKTSSSYRTIPIPNFLLRYLEELYDESSKFYDFNDNWYVFGDIDPLPETTLRSRKTENAVKAKVKDIRIHDFRHSCASLLIDNGANITLVAKYLGHSKIDETLNTYSHMYQNRLENIVTLIEVQNSKMLASKPKELPTRTNEPKILDYTEYKKDIYIIDKKSKNKEDLVR